MAADHTWSRGSVREALAICMRREHLRQTVKIALVVGTVLALINQSDVVLDGEATAGTWLKIGLTYCVPFVVSNLGLLAGKRAELEHATAADRIRGAS